MKKLIFTRFEKAVILFTAISFLFAFTVHYSRMQKVNRLNARVSELINEGNSVEASKKIASVEFGFIPLDDEYNALIED
jgi:hypothetical protein